MVAVITALSPFAASAADYTYGTPADFGQGTQDTQYSSSAGGLVLNARTATPPFLYVSDQNSGQVFKFDGSGGLVGAYPSCVGCSTAPNTWNPSSIAVDMDGTPWVVNVGSGASKTVTRLGSNPRSIQMVADDASAIAVDDQGMIWVGGTNKGTPINPATFATGNPFGLGSATPISFSARAGWIYAVTGDANGNVFRFTSAGKDNKGFTCSNARSVVVDGGGKAWIATTQGLATAAFPAPQTGSPSCAMVAGTPSVILEGIALDPNGKVWMAAPGKTGKSPQPQAVYVYDPVARTFTSIPVSGIGEPRGVAVTADGTAWIVGRNGLAHVVSGSVMSFPMSGVYFDTTSDMTGAQLRNAVQQGTWTVTQDAGFAGAIWGSVSWLATSPAGTSVAAQVRASDSSAALATAPRVAVSNGTAFNFGAVAGRYLQVQFTLKGSEQITPVLRQITITPSGAALGATCTANDDCASGVCADGVCCNTACGGQCEACAEPGTLGTCVAVQGAPRTGRQGCATDGSSCGGTCDGTLRAACTYPGTAVSCKDASCSGGNETLAATCDGQGACPVTTNGCNRYVCGPNACLTACQSDQDCSTANLCESGACIADKVPPAITLAALAPYTNKPSLTISGTVTDRGGVAAALLKLNGQVAVPTLTLGPDGGWSATVNLAEGANELVVEATDLAGNPGSASVSTTLDTIPPALTITSPAPSQAFGSSTGIAFQLAVGDATSVTVFAGGTQQSAPDQNGVVAGTIDAQGGLGYDTLTFAAVDAAGNTTTRTVDVFLDLYAPVITSEIDGLKQLGPVTQDVLAFKVEVNEAGAFDYSYTGIDAPQHVDRLQGATVFVSLPLTEGPNTFSFTATDEVNHSVSPSWSFVYDKTPPSGTFAAPAADGQYLRGGADFLARASDNLTGVASIAFRVDGGATAPGVVATEPGADYPYSAPYAVDTTTLADGPHVIYAELKDGVGNASTVQRSFVADNTPPTVSLALAPTADGNVVASGGVQYARGTIAITATATDATSGIADLHILVGGKEIAPCDSSPCTVEFDTRAIGSDGPFSIVATAADGAGNKATPAQDTPTADNTAPTNFVASPTNGAVLTGDTMTVAAAFSGGTATVVCSMAAAGPWTLTADQPSVTVNLLDQLDGDLAVTCTATDLVGNSSKATVTPSVRHWTEVLDPVTLNLKTGGNSVVTYYVEGKNVGILVPIAARDLNLVIPNASPIPALAHPASAAVGDYNRNGIPDLTLKFDRPSLIKALQGAIAAKAIDPSKPVTVRLFSGGHDLGQTTIRVNP